MSSIRAVLTDIEGTTSSISFVKEVLFPYAREHLPAFLAEYGEEPEVARWLARAGEEAGEPDADIARIQARLLTWIDQDRKSTALKALQGMIWQRGYAEGAYRSHIYPEVPARLRAWRERGLQLYVYSSGSAAAQRLLFAHTEQGNLSDLFQGHFDTEIGAKREVASYRRIAETLGLAPQELLFLSDVVEELDAAREAGYATGWLLRPPAALPHTPAHPAYSDFDAISP